MASATTSSRESPPSSSSRGGAGVPPKDSSILPFIWQDREIRFDLSLKNLTFRAGEFLIDFIEPVEDTKGNRGVTGVLQVTNLRVIWSSAKNSKPCFSIGYNCVHNISFRSVYSRLRGSTQAVYISTKFSGTRFQFIFTHMINNNPEIFATVQSVAHVYESTKMYRDLKLRSAIIDEGELIMLPEEQLYHKASSVWNLAAEQGNLGTFVITNIRLVWFANISANFNCSIPYMQMKSVRVRESRFGKALVIESLPQAGGYLLGFRIDPVQALYEVATEIKRVRQIYANEPNFGIRVSPVSCPSVSFPKPNAVDDSEIVGEEDPDACVLYYDEIQKNIDREPVFSEEIGLAVEQLLPGLTMRSLWNVVQTENDRYAT